MRFLPRINIERELEATIGAIKWERGTLVKHEQIASASGVPYANDDAAVAAVAGGDSGSARAARRTAQAKWRKLIGALKKFALRKHGIAMVAAPTLGYTLMPAEDQVTYGAARIDAARKHVRRAAGLVAVVDPALLSSLGQKLQARIADDAMAVTKLIDTQKRERELFAKRECLPRPNGR